MTGVIPSARLRQVQPRELAPAPEPEPGILDTVTAAFRTTQDEVSATQERRTFDAYQTLEDELVARGVDRKTLRYAPAFSLFGQGDIASRVPNMDAIWQGVEDARARDPSAFATIPKTRAAYEEMILTRRGGRAADERTLAGARGVTGFAARMAGGVGGSFTDPFNILTAPLGGGAKTIGQALLYGAVTNAVLETVQTPDLIANRARMGEETGALDVAGNIALAAVGGAVLEGAGKAVTMHGGAVVDAGRAAFETVIADHWDKLPQTVRVRWANAASIPDSALPDMAELLIGADRLSPDERAAMAVLRREGAIDAANPFVPNGAGVAAHRDGLGSALQRILDDVPPARTTQGALRAGASQLAMDAGTPRAAFMARVRGAESSGDDLAQAATSSAFGRYQFTRGTWIAYYKRRFGGQGMSDDAIAALRSDGRLQDQLMADLTADNAAVLRETGAAETAGNLYLAHFAGRGGVRRILTAEPEARLDALLPAEAIRANPFLRDMTAGDLIRWAHDKMGEPVPPPPGARVELAGGDAADSARAAIQAELDRVQAERAQLLRDDAAARAQEEGLPLPERPLPSTAIEPVPFDVPVRAGEPALPEPAPIVRKPRTPYKDRSPVDALKFIARRGGLTPTGLADDPGGTLGRGHDLARLFEETQTGTRKDGTKWTRRGTRFVPGAGSLARDGGMTLDQAGEALWEAGYFGPAGTVPRPTIADTLALLEANHLGDRKFSIHDIDAVNARIIAEGRAAADESWREAHAAHAAAEGVQLDDDALARWMAVSQARGEEPAASWGTFMAHEFDDAHAQMLAELDDLGYYPDHGNPYDDPGLGREGDNLRAGGSGRAAEPGNAGAKPQGGGDGPDGAAEADSRGWTDPNYLKGFDDPAGPDAQAQADSIAHDLFGGATREEARQALEKRMEGGLSNEAAQKPAGSDGGLFDNAHAQIGFRLDEEGDVVNPADLLAELGEEEDALKAIKDCL